MSLAHALSLGLAPSSDAWIAAAIADPATLLVDHAHCERKAAQTALRFVQQRPSGRLVSSLSRLAREELVHFERVVAELHRRAIPLVTLPSAGYAQALFALAGDGGRRNRAVDELLLCAIIEARSHERFVRLCEASPDAVLRTLYADLLEAEARHGALYVELAEELSTDGDALAERLAALCEAEDPIVHRLGQPLRMHAGG